MGRVELRYKYPEKTNSFQALIHFSISIKKRKGEGKVW
jgi:hypothetical protein